MRKTVTHSALALVVFAGLAATAAAQAPAPGAPNIAVVEKPTYQTFTLETTINKPVAEVWKRVGSYCAIGEWLQIPAGCKIISGKEGDVGSVRSVGNEIMVAKTEYSYSYTQPVRGDRPYNLYHGTLEARAASPTTTRMLYTILWDNSMVADDAGKEKDKAGRTATFTRALANIKTIAEGGTLPPPASPPPGGGN
jgi:hypothetical protein